MYPDQKIDYTNYLRDRPREKDPEKLAAMEQAVTVALKWRRIKLDDVSCEYYADGRVRVNLNGKFYSMFDAGTGKFFSGSPGD